MIKLTKKFTTYYSEDNENSLVSNDVRTLYIDDEGILWIGTRRWIMYF